MGWLLAEVDITAEQARLGIWVNAFLLLFNVLAGAVNAWYNKHTATKIELARIAAESAERIAIGTAKKMDETAKRSKEAHEELSAKVDEISAALPSNGT